jgi:hypothetical protein
MSEANTSSEQKVLQIGPDRVTIKDNEVVIEARDRMPEWQVRELNPPPVYFQDRRYRLMHISKGESPYMVRYLLVPWPSDLTTTSKLFYAYDAEAVAERDGARRSGQAEEVTRACLLPFYPLLGLLWSGAQRRLGRFGFVPHSISGISIFMVFCFAFAQGIFAIVTINASVRSKHLVIGGVLRAMSNHESLQLGPVSIPLVWLDCALTLACLADVLIRYSHYLREHDWSGGFLEWLVRRQQPENSTAEA